MIHGSASSTHHRRCRCSETAQVLAVVIEIGRKARTLTDDGVCALTPKALP
jgi:hypothetical protein